MAMPICMYSTPSADEGKCVVEFDLNYDGAKTIESTSVKKGCAIQMGDCLNAKVIDLSSGSESVSFMFSGINKL